MSLTHSVWPPPYQMRISPRAKYIRLQICRDQGLQLIVPKRATEKEALIFLNQKRTWVEKQLVRCRPKRQSAPLPYQIHFMALEKIWQVTYMENKVLEKIQLLQRPQAVVLFGKINNTTRCKQHLLHWVRAQAEQALLPWLDTLSEQLKLPYSSLQIRNQKTRWGSCSREGNINLNFRLLFLPKILVNYILIHELCHTVHLNHSMQFWELVAKHCPNYHEARVQLRQVDHWVPDWAN